MRHTYLLDSHCKIQQDRLSQKICNYYIHLWVYRFSHHNPHSIKLFHHHKKSNNSDILEAQVDLDNPNKYSPPRTHNIPFNIYIGMYPFVRWRPPSKSDKTYISLYQGNYCIFYKMGDMLEKYN